MLARNNVSQSKDAIEIHLSLVPMKRMMQSLFDRRKRCEEEVTVGMVVKVAAMQTTMKRTIIPVKGTSTLILSANL